MSTVFFSVTVSVDGYMAPDGMKLEHAHDPNYKDWMAQWMELQQWAFPQQFLRENLKLGQGGETGPSNELLRHTFARTGANIMGKNMFAGGEKSWPEEAPFHTDVFVLTHEVRSPWERPGGTTFYFVIDGIDSALRQAREAAGDKDIRLSGGADLILQYLDAGWVDEFTLSVSPVFLGGGTPLFEGIDRKKLGLRIAEVVPTPQVTHVRYTVTRR
jgi:dihydrofolate reductase